MKSVSWTEKQAEAIETRNKNILVSAAAGSGKTAVLVERIKRLIIDEHVSVSEMLVATFTNAAASDMKEKTVKAIQKAVSENPTDARFLKEQLDKVYKANISTFHSFAIEVIRRYFYVINADPGFKICDDAEKTILQTESLDELFEEKFESGDERFINFLTSYCGAKSEKKAKDMVLHVHGAIQALPAPFAWLSEKAGMLAGDDETLYEYLRPFIMRDAVESLEYALGLFKTVSDILERGGDMPGLAVKSRADAVLTEEALTEAAAGNYTGTAKRISEMSFARFVAGKGEKAAYEIVRDRTDKLRSKAKECVKELRDKYFSEEFNARAEMIRATREAVNTLFGLVAGFDEAYKEKKRERALLDFNDIEHLAIEILKNKDVAEEYRRKFRYIFVDEYQDSNLIQETMIESIKRSDNVFMVGDVKQSIYKFRLAEPELFMEKYEAYSNKEGGGENTKIDLNTNFRCKGYIIDAVNGICGRIMPYDENSALHKGVSYPAPLNFPGPLDYPVELHIVETKEAEDGGVDGEINELKKVELEAETAVKLIRSAVGDKIHEEGRGDEGNVRCIRLKDVVILMRAIRNYGDRYYQILAENDIPAFIDDSGGYFDTVEIDVFMNLLRVIDNKRRDIPLISLLYSRIMGFNADELAAIRAARGDVSYYRAFESYAASGENPALREKCGNAHEKIEGWRRLSLVMPLEELIRKLMWDTGYYIYAGALPGGEQRQANLRALVDKSLKYLKANPGGGLYGFLQYAEMLKRRGVQTGQVTLVGENDDVVRIMTVHKSKGLEFPVVIIAGLGRRFMSGRENSEARVHKNIGIALPFYDAENKKLKKTLLQTVIENENKRAESDEEARILYVALTRAKDKLFLLGTVSDAGKALENYSAAYSDSVRAKACYMDMIAPVFLEKGLPYTIYNRNDIFSHKEKSEGFKEALRKTLTGEGEAECDDKTGYESKTECDDEIRKLVESRLSYEYADKKALSAKSKYSVSEITRGKRPASAESSRAVPLFMQGKQKPTRAEIGTALHTVMEKLDFKEAAQAFDSGSEAGYEYLSALVSRLVAGANLTRDEADVINLTKVAAFIESDIGRRAARADKLQKETPFNMIKEIDGIETIIQGVIDCFFEEDGEYVIIDYKSDYISRDEDIENIKEMYSGQIELYGEALETIKKVKVKERFLYLFSKSAAVSV